MRDPILQLAQLEKLNEKFLERRPYERSLIDFSQLVWEVVEPAIPFVKGRVLSAIAEHLEAVTDGQIHRLLINVPPGFTKSLLTDAFWPAWEWGPRGLPHYRYICASYSEALTIRDNMRCRSIVMSDIYQSRWGGIVNVSPDQFSKIKFANNKTGWKLATSVGGLGLGERGDRFIIDDPHNTMEMESDAVRNTTKTWFTEVVPTRLNNMEKSAIVIIMQRLHQDDVSGLALSRDMGFEHLMIPMEFDTTRICHTSIGWEDWREKDGELAWPERFSQKVCDKLKNDLGSYAWASQFQQFPVPRGGEIVKEAWWKEWKEKFYPSCEFILASLDTAYTSKEENDYSALTIWGLFRDAGGNAKLILMYSWKLRLEFPDLVTKVINTCTVDKRRVSGHRFPVDLLIIEDKAAGHSLHQELRRLLAVSHGSPFGINLVKASSGMGGAKVDKRARVASITHIFEQGMVYAPVVKDDDGEGFTSFAQDVIEEFAYFPRGSHDDLVDSATHAIRYLRDNGYLLRAEEQKLEDEAEIAYSPGRQPLYPV